jgi:hypothetical protein
MTPAESVDAYIARPGGWQTDLMERLRRIVTEEAPSASVFIKWGRLVWDSNGPATYVQAFTTKVNLGFWRGAEMNDPRHLLQGTGRSRHLSLLPDEPLPEGSIRDFVRQAVILNRLMGSPARRA